MRNFRPGFPMMLRNDRIIMFVVALVFGMILASRLSLPGWLTGGKERMELETEYLAAKLALELEVDTANTETELLEIELGLETLRVAHEIHLADLRRKASIMAIVEPVLYTKGVLFAIGLAQIIYVWGMRRATTVHANAHGIFPLVRVPRFNLSKLFDPNRNVGAWAHDDGDQLKLPPGQREATAQAQMVQLGRALASGETDGKRQDLGDLVSQRRLIGPGMPKVEKAEIEPGHIETLLAESGLIQER